MISIKIPKGYRLPAIGRPSVDIDDLAPPMQVGVHPAATPGIKPLLKVQTGDRVSIGSLLLVDKHRPDIRFLSPGGGTVESITIGPRRSVSAVAIRLDAEESRVGPGELSPANISDMERRDLVEYLLAGGVWPFFRSLPYYDIADPTIVPPSIIVSLSDLEPFHPDPRVYLPSGPEMLQAGLEVLKRLTPRVVVTIHEDHDDGNWDIPGITVYRLSGDYPATDPGVLLYRTKTSAAEHGAWFIDGQDLLAVSQLAQTGLYPVERVVVLAGSAVKNPKHVRTRMGIPLTHLVGTDAPGTGVRTIDGGVFRGRTAEVDDFLGWYGKTITRIPEGTYREFLGFVRPGYRKTSYSRTFLSCLNRSLFPVDTNIHGGLRACIACGFCAEVCPVDILPQLTYKAVLAGEVEFSLRHGLLDCVECGLCSYVCPSKIDVSGTLQTAKAAYYREI